jgi:predicted outer membrane lipoprotein
MMTAALSAAVVVLASIVACLCLVIRAMWLEIREMDGTNFGRRQ